MILILEGRISLLYPAFFMGGVVFFLLKLEHLIKERFFL